MFFFFCHSLIAQNEESSEFKSSSFQQARCTQFNDSVQACYGPGWSKSVKRYEDPYDFYEISVEEISKTGSVVLFKKTFKAKEVLGSVLNDYSEGLVSLSKDGSTLKFKIQEQPFSVSISQYVSSNKALKEDADKNSSAF